MKFVPILVILVVNVVCYRCDKYDDDGIEVGPAYRLPKHVEPYRYDLKVMTDLEEPDFAFTGTVCIKIRVLYSTNRIILHSKRLNITEKSVRLWSVIKNRKVAAMKIIHQEFDLEYDFYIITVNQTLTEATNYKLCIPFAGILETGLVGYYRTSYVDQTTGTTEWMAVTQFEPTDARRAFPCFDEPAMKAVFSITIGHSKKYKAISNMPLMSISDTENNRGWILETFEDTKRMSTYLVAYMVSGLEYKVSNLNYSPGIVCRTWARKDVVDQTEFARDIAPKILTFFEELFDVPYGLPKMDLVAVPDFGAGAMENWGLITFGERSLLYDSNQSSIFDKHAVAKDISHELAHQWFGNLITINYWWTDLWLKEAFAALIADIGVHYMFPEWKTLEDETLDNLLSIFEIDSLKSTHAVSVPIGNPKEIPPILDAIFYRKGCFLLRMAYHFLTEEVFHRGVKRYLKDHLYGNASECDLWNSMTEAAHDKSVLSRIDSVNMIMETWTLESGYPLLTIRRQYENQTAIIVQERYLSSKFRWSKEKLEKSCWLVPLTYTSSSELDFQNTRPKSWLPCGGPFIISNIAGKENWVIFNIKATVLYRVNYDEENWKMLWNTLANKEEFRKIPAMNRVLLISDMLALAWINRLEYKRVLNVLQYLKHETEYLPLKTALHAFNRLNSLLIRTSVRSQYERYVKELIKPIYQTLAANISEIPVDYERVKHHSIIVRHACHYDVEDCRTQTKNLFHSWYSQVKRNNPIPNNIRRDVYCNALKYADEKYWTFLWNQYTRCNAVSERHTMLEALACSRNMSRLKEYLNWTLDEAKIRKQDSLTVFHHVANNEAGYIPARQFLIDNFDKIYDLHAYNPSNVGYYVKTIAKQIITEVDLNEFENFVNSKSDQLKTSYMAVQHGLEIAKNNIGWHSVHFKRISSLYGDDSKRKIS